MEGTITLDGWSNEAAWQNIEPLPVMMYMPVWGGEPTARTEIRITYNDEYIYVSGRLFYRQSDMVQATTRKRDNGATVNDMFHVSFDTYNDNETALGFMTTPAGTRSVAAFINDNEGPVDVFWKTS